MRVGIDARVFQSERTGVENYLHHFLDNLQQIDRKNEYWLFSNQPECPHDISQPNFHWAPALSRSRIPFDTWMFHGLPRDLRNNRIDVFYSSGTKVPTAKVGKIVTVHGLEWRYCSEGYTFHERARQWFWFTLSMRLADRVVAVSENTKRDILKSFPQINHKITVIPEGVDHVRFHVIDDPSRVEVVLRKYGIERPYLLAVSTLSPRKNLVRLMEAYADLIRSHALPHQLVVVGKEGWLYGGIAEWRARHPELEPAIRFTGYLPDEDLVYLYNAAELFVYPSIYEGFGLPVLEAMACGVPVVASRATSLPEVVGDAGILVDPLSVADIARGILGGLMDQERRLALRARGLARARTFTWKRMTERIVALWDADASRA